MKNLYVTTSTIKNGDSFDICVTWDKAEALQAADLEHHHLTPREREKTIIGINVYAIGIPTDDTRDAKEVYGDLLDVFDDSIQQPVDYIEYKA